jgi:glyoxylase-like metal-dependent hydrolase (beta-lactamase superfamily II)
MEVQTFFDKATSTLTYVVYDPKTKDSILIDPVLDYLPGASKVSTESVEKAASFINENNLNLHLIMETHAHADHLSGAPELKKKFSNAKTAIGEKITMVQRTFAKAFNLKDFKSDGSQFDLLLKNGQTIEAGSIKIKVIATPGHTPSCSSYLIENMVFTGDSLFMPDFGTGRCDFPAGDAGVMYDSIMKKLYKLPDTTKVYVGHDYQPGGRELKFQTTIGEEKEKNIHLKIDTTKEAYVEFRTNRDKTLQAPNLLLQSIQVNINGGLLPPKEDNGVSYLKIPINK